MRKIAIIPARAGSKGLKNKNIIDLCGKPMMNYSIEAALRADCFDRVIVSTDSVEYGKIANDVGAEVIYRDEKVSNDTATTYVVLQDLFKRVHISFDYFVLLQPTSPLRDEHHIKEAIKLFEARSCDFDFLLSVKESEHSSILVKPIDNDLSLKHFNIDFSNYRRQGYKEYSPNGAIFLGKPDAYLRQKHFFGDRSLAYIMNDFDSIDVDTELDYKFATLCMKEKLGISNG